MKILIATGGSGGHIFPALETAKALRVRGHQVSVAGVLGLAQDKIKALDFPVYALSAKGLDNRSFAGWYHFLRLMFKAIFFSLRVVRQSAPDKVIGFGGYGAFPVVMAAALMGRPVLIHEQNVIPGKANLFLSTFVKRIAISFEASRKYLPVSKVVWTGCPCHLPALGAKTEALNAFGLEHGKKTIMLLGGSQGSHRLNEIFFELMEGFSQGSYQAIHMTGPKDFDVYQKRYQEAGLPVKVYAFINQIGQAYAAADVVVARAGAATVSELGLLGIPAVLVPYPFAGNHQKYNAKVLADCGAAVLIEQKELTVQNLKEALETLAKTHDTRDAILLKTTNLFQKEAALQLALVTEGL